MISMSAILERYSVTTHRVWQYSLLNTMQMLTKTIARSIITFFSFCFSLSFIHEPPHILSGFIKSCSVVSSVAVSFFFQHLFTLIYTFEVTQWTCIINQESGKKWEIPPNIWIHKTHFSVNCKCKICDCVWIYLVNNKVYRGFRNFYLILQRNCGARKTGKKRNFSWKWYVDFFVHIFLNSKSNVIFTAFVKHIVFMWKCFCILIFLWFCCIIQQNWKKKMFVKTMSQNVRVAADLITVWDKVITNFIASCLFYICFSINTHFFRCAWRILEIPFNLFITWEISMASNWNCSLNGFC